ncbi:MAG: DUF2182 domain-containing protein [Pseudomonadota bacterium]
MTGRAPLFVHTKTVLAKSLVARAATLGRRPAWLGFYAIVLLAWAGLYAMALPPEMLAAASAYGAEFWLALCQVPPGLAGYPSIFAMWVIMAAAMMAPGFVPALTTYDDLTQGRGFWPFTAGYALVWLGASAVAAWLQLGFSTLGISTPQGVALTPWFAALLLALAGAYQFSPLKQACLSRCRAPLAFFMSHWRENAGVSLGLRHGLDCLGCCWALMALAFAGGTVSPLFMGVATLLMAVEKLPGPGRYISAPLGVALLVGATATALAAIV